MKDVTHEINEEANRRAKEAVTKHDLGVIAAVYREISAEFASYDPNKTMTNGSLAHLFATAAKTLEVVAKNE